MTSDADRTIEALRAVHDDLAARVGGWTDADLARPSGASQWSVAQVLSHVGSGAEITLGGLRAAMDGASAQSGQEQPSGQEKLSNEAVWDRWNAMTPREQADGCVAGDAEMVQAFEALDDDTRRTLLVPLTFLPEPVGIDLVAGLRLNESALHGWDVAVADDPGAVLHPTAVPVLVDAMAGPLSFMVGFTAKGQGTDGVLAVHPTDPDRRMTLEVAEQVALRPVEAAGADGTLALPAEAFLRLISGRLGPQRRPAAVTVTGPLDLDNLRAVFLGY